MTQSPPPQPPEETARELLAVTQADRDAAADHVEGDGSHSGYMLGTMIREGRHDDYPLVQAFGRDRFTRAIEQCAEIVREAARTWQWEAEEDDGYAYRLKACAERRAQSPGTDDDCPQDGSCGECATEMHEHFETPASKERRRELRCLADAISALDPTTRATLTHPISREAVAITDDVVRYIHRYGGRCRDCADENGICPKSSLPCADDGKAVRFVLEALNYGLSHGYLATPPSPSCLGVVEALEEIASGAARGLDDFKARMGGRKAPTWYAVNVLQDNLAACQGTARTALQSHRGEGR